MNDKLVCPECVSALQRRPVGRKAAWGCPGCSGLALNLAVVRASIDDRLATAFWALAQTAQPVSRRCPSCRRDLRQIQHAVGSERVELDVCTGCQLIWFDHGELERFGDARSLRAAAPQAVRQKTKREHDPAIVHSTALIVDGVGDVLELAWDIVSSWD